jgi:hypothetical protein
MGFDWVHRMEAYALEMGIFYSYTIATWVIGAECIT